jgi:hypothetical protein
MAMQRSSCLGGGGGEGREFDEIDEEMWEVWLFFKLILLICVYVCCLWLGWVVGRSMIWEFNVDDEM